MVLISDDVLVDPKFGTGALCVVASLSWLARCLPACVRSFFCFCPVHRFAGFVLLSLLLLLSFVRLTGAVKITPAHDPNDFACGEVSGAAFVYGAVLYLYLKFAVIWVNRFPVGLLMHFACFACQSRAICVVSDFRACDAWCRSQRAKLPSINIFDDSGAINENGGEFKGMPRFTVCQLSLCHYMSLRSSLC
jgi:hypothetical protein